MRGATTSRRCRCCQSLISIHAPHARSDARIRTSYRTGDGFQSTLLMRGATAGTCRRKRRRSNFNPRSSCEERPLCLVSSCRHPPISIHAPHARSDVCGASPMWPNHRNFNPRSSCEERPLFRWLHLIDLLFQSTLLMRGATSLSLLKNDGRYYFNPRSSCEERRRQCRQAHTQADISIHAPHARSDSWNFFPVVCSK